MKLELMIVGSQKCGTSSLKEYLAQHPRLQSHFTTEFSYFIDDDEWSAGFQAAVRRHFKIDDARPKIGKSAGLCISAVGLDRLRDHNPDCKIVFMVREPAERAHSSYLMEQSYGAGLPPFEEVLSSVLSSDDRSSKWFKSFILYGMYADLLEGIHTRFPAENVRVVDLKSLRHNPEGVCADLFEWLGVPPLDHQSFLVHNRTRRERSAMLGRVIQWLRAEGNPIKSLARRHLPPRVVTRAGRWIRELNRHDDPLPTLSEAARHVLVDYYRPENVRFAQLAGIDISAWF